MSAHTVPKVILFVEDNGNDVVLLERIVTRYFPNHRLQAVSSGAEAIRYLQGAGVYANRARFPFPELVVLDVMLSDMDGLQVLAWIRAQPQTRGLVVLVLTNSDSEEHLRRAYELHANSFLKKDPLLVLPQVSKGFLEYWLNLNQLPHS